MSSFTYENVQPEFVAVVLASTVGARLFPMSSSAQPKHLLPVAGLPSLERLLSVLSDFSQVFIAIAADDQTTVPTLFEGNDLWRAENVTVVPDVPAPPTTTAASPAFPQPHSVWKPSNNETTPIALPTSVTIVRMPEECPGSAEVIRQLEGLLPRQAHTLVLPGDLVVTKTSTSISALLQAHRQGQTNHNHNSKEKAACTLLLQDVGEQDEQGVPLKESAKLKKGGLAREPEDIEYMAIAFGTTSTRLLWKQGKMEAEQDEAFTLTGQTPKLNLPKARFRPSGVVKVRQDWNDLHVYVLAPWVVRLVQAKTSIVSLQRDLLPLLVRRQWLGKVETFGQYVEPHRILEILEEDVVNANHDSSTSILHTATTTTNNLIPRDAHSPNMVAAMAMKPKQTYSVLAHVGTGAMRNSSLPAYLYASKDFLLKMVDPARQRQDSDCLRLPSNATTNPKLVSLLLKDATIGDKPTLKASIIGKGCQLGNKCRLNNVVLMDDVQLGDNVVLQNTIVGKAAVIGDNCSLNDCQVAAGVKVESGTKEKGEVLVDSVAVVG